MYTWLNLCPFDYKTVVVIGKVKRSETSGMTVGTPTDRPQSVRNRCVIEVFGGVFLFLRCFLDISVGVWGFVIG